MRKGARRSERRPVLEDQDVDPNPYKVTPGDEVAWSFRRRGSTFQPAVVRFPEASSDPKEC